MELDVTEPRAQIGRGNFRLELALELVKEDYATDGARAACTAMKDQVDAMFPERFFAGDSTVVETEPGHVAQSFDKLDADGNTEWTGMHIDEDFMNRAIRQGNYVALTKVMLHEGGHVAGYSHPGETAEPYDAYPFRHVSAGTDVEQCY